MALLDRYLKDVAMWLPHGQSRDIVDELRADIEAQIDAEREATGRALTAEEEQAILTRWGHPMLVASRYQPHQPFIGPTLLPTYYFVLKMVALVYLLPWFLFWLGRVAVISGGSVDAGDAWTSLQPLIIQALVLFALITGIFAAVERRHRRERTLESWHARELESSPSRDWREKSRASALFDLVIDLAVLSWWIGLAGAPDWFALDPAVRVTMPAASAFVYWAVIVLVTGSAAMAVADLWRPRWNARRLGLQIALDLAAVGVGLVLISYSIVQVVPGADTDLARSTEMVRWINLSWKATIGVIVAILAGRVALHVRRIGRVRSLGDRHVILRNG